MRVSNKILPTAHIATATGLHHATVKRIFDKKPDVSQRSKRKFQEGLDQLIKETQQALEYLKFLKKTV